MSDYEYKTVLAPTRPAKIRGVRDYDERIERTLSDAINAGCSSGWEFFGTETLTIEDGGGLFSKAQSRQVTFLVFTRLKEVKPLPSDNTKEPSGTANPRLGPAH